MPTIALVLFLVSLIGLIYLALNKLMFLDVTKKGWHRAARELPGFASTKGLDFIKGNLVFEIGEIHGTYRGRYIEFKPDENATIKVSLLKEGAVEIGTYPSQLQRPPEGMAHFDFGNNAIDRFLRKRFADINVSRQLIQSKELLDYVCVFRKKWKRSLRFLEISASGIRCSMKYGLGSYIPTGVLDVLLPDIYGLAEVLEGAIESEQQKAGDKSE